LLAAVSVAPAHAMSVSYYLDQSNDLADGTNYLMVTISDSTTVSGQIDFKVETLAALNGIAGTNFGIQDFAFNVTLSTLPPDTALINLPTGWSGNVNPPLNAADGFGKFEFEVSNGGSNRLSVLTFSVDAAGDSIYSYYENSTGTAAQGNGPFAAHVAGFTPQSCTSGTCTSAWFGAAPVPEADTWAMMMAGLGLVGLRLRKRMAGAHRIQA
jgi:hypothetical protein